MSVMMNSELRFLPSEVLIKEHLSWQGPGKWTHFQLSAFDTLPGSYTLALGLFNSCKIVKCPLRTGSFQLIAVFTRGTSPSSLLSMYSPGQAGQRLTSWTHGADGQQVSKPKIARGNTANIYSCQDNTCTLLETEKKHLQDPVFI